MAADEPQHQINCVPASARKITNRRYGIETLGQLDSATVAIAAPSLSISRPTEEAQEDLVRSRARLQILICIRTRLAARRV